jgi:hypothetical protein
MDPQYFWWVVGTFTVICIFFVLPFLGGFGSEDIFNEKLMVEGLTAEAEILAYTCDEFWSVKYRFTPKDRSGPIECEKGLRQRVEFLPVGTKVTVRYLERYPGISVLEPYAKAQWS